MDSKPLDVIYRTYLIEWTISKFVLSGLDFIHSTCNILEENRGSYNADRDQFGSDGRNNRWISILIFRMIVKA